MKDITTLALPAHTLCRLLQYVDAHPAEASASELAALAIEEWLARGEARKSPCARHQGYQWKSVFLPEGTQLRAWNRNGFAYAEVIGDVIMFNGEAVSPHEFICRCKGISRSAWTEVALLLPGEDHWRRADAFRRELAKGPALQAAPTPPPPLSAQSPGGFSTVLPPVSAPIAPPAKHTRLPRVLPIPTQARHQSTSRATGAVDRETVISDRRKAYRRQEDLLLD